MRNEADGKSLCDFKQTLSGVADSIQGYTRCIQSSCEALAPFLKAMDGGSPITTVEEVERLLRIEFGIAEIQARMDACRSRLESSEAAGSDRSTERRLLAACEEALAAIRKDKFRLVRIYHAGW